MIEVFYTFDFTFFSFFRHHQYTANKMILKMLWQLMKYVQTILEHRVAQRASSSSNLSLGGFNVSISFRIQREDLIMYAMREIWLKIILFRVEIWNYHVSFQYLQTNYLL